MDLSKDVAQVPPPRVTLDDLVEGLTGMGLEAGDRVVVHSSLSSLGRVDGGADTVVEALLTVLGPAGTLMMPRFTPYDVATSKVFDRQNPPPSSTGIVPNALLRQPGAILSLHPSHSVVALGPQAAFLTEGHFRVSPVGKGSPFDRMTRIGGKILLLGVTHVVNTTIHVGEAYAGVAYWGIRRPDRPKRLEILDQDRKRRWVTLSEIPLDTKGFNRIEPLLIEHGVIAFGRIGSARVRLVDARPLVEAVVEHLQCDPAGLLCDLPDCYRCDLARHQIAKG